MLSPEQQDRVVALTQDFARQGRTDDLADFLDHRNNRDQSSIAGALFKGEDNVVAQLVAAGADLNAGTPTARQAAQLFGRGHLLPERDV